MKGFNKTIIALALGGLSMSAYAAPYNFYLELDGTGNAAGASSDLGISDGTTGSKVYGQVGYQSETIVSAGVDGLTAGDSVHTTGGLNLGGTFDLANFEFNSISSFSPGGDSEGISNDATVIEINDSKNYGLSFTMDLDGKIAGFTGGGTPLINYTSGLIEMYLIRSDDTTNSIEAAHAFDLNLTGSNPSNEDNYQVFGTIGFSGNEDTALADLFHLDGVECAVPAGGTSFKDLADCVSPPITVTWLVAQNLQAPTFGPGPNPGEIKLTGTHGGQLYFGAEVPEPATMLLLGGGLLGLGFTARRRKS